VPLPDERYPDPEDWHKTQKELLASIKHLLERIVSLQEYELKKDEQDTKSRF
jgi:hypothetical protein